MIDEYVSNLAAQNGIRLSEVSIVEGWDVGFFDAYFLHLSSNGKKVTTLVYQSELDSLKNNSGSDGLESKVRSAISRLQSLFPPLSEHVVKSRRSGRVYKT